MQCAAHCHQAPETNNGNTLQMGAGLQMAHGGQEGLEGWREEEIWMLAMVAKEASGRARYLTHAPIQLLPY